MKDRTSLGPHVSDSSWTIVYVRTKQKSDCLVCRDSGEAWVAQNADNYRVVPSTLPQFHPHCLTLTFWHPRFKQSNQMWSYEKILSLVDHPWTLQLHPPLSVSNGLARDPSVWPLAVCTLCCSVSFLGEKKRPVHKHLVNRLPKQLGRSRKKAVNELINNGRTLRVHFQEASYRWLSKTASHTSSSSVIKTQYSPTKMPGSGC